MNKFIIAKQEGRMASISDLYSLHHSSSSGGIEGYHIEKKYYDPVKMKEERILSTSKDKPQGAKPVNVSKKTTFIDEVIKKTGKLPGPTSYESSIQHRERANSEVIKHPDRKTYIDDITRQAIKKHVPGAGTYGKVDTEIDKSKLKPNLSRAESPTYAEACMRNSLETPGVGNYNAYRAVLDHKGNKWDKEDEKNKKKGSPMKLPPVGTYNPEPKSYRLFSSVADSTGKKTGIYAMGGKTQRWKTPKEKKLPFYNILSEWGVQKHKKKDILSKISSSPASSRSVYY